MALAYYRNDLTDSLGNAVAGASVTVREHGTLNAITETIKTLAGATLTNPLTSASTGTIEFALDEPKRVDLYIVASGLLPKTITVDLFPSANALNTKTVNAKDHGAKGDGTTDDKAAIQAALNALTSGGVLLVPAGTYMLSGSLSVKSNVTIQGQGKRATVLKFAAGVSSSTKMFVNSDQAGGNTGIVIQHLTADGNRASNGAVSGLTGVSFSKVDRCAITFCRFTGFTQHCIDFTGESGGAGGDNTQNLVAFNDLEDYGTGSVGFGVAFVGGGYRNRIIGNHITSTLTNVGVGIDDQSGPQTSDPCLRNVVANNVISGMAQGVLVEGSHENVVTGNTILDCTEACIVFAEGATPLAPRDNSAEGNKLFPAAGAKGVILVGNGNGVKGGSIIGGQYGVFIGDISPGIGPNRRLSVVGVSFQGQTLDAVSVTAGKFIKLSQLDMDSPERGVHINSSNRSIEQVYVDGVSVKNAKKEAVYVVSGANSIATVRLRDISVVNAGTAAAGTYAAITCYQQTSSLDDVFIDGYDVVDDQGGSRTTLYGVYVLGSPTNVRLREGFIGTMQTARYSLVAGCHIQASGAGTPEAAIAAAIGSTWRRTDGGAATSFYVKESGTGNTGWVGK